LEKKIRECGACAAFELPTDSLAARTRLEEEKVMESGGEEKKVRGAIKKK
jgi:hypothetical protein